MIVLEAQALDPSCSRQGSPSVCRRLPMCFDSLQVYLRIGGVSVMAEHLYRSRKGPMRVLSV